MIELPKYRGIEEAMQDVKTFAHAKGLEKAIGLLPDGRRCFEKEGDATGVNLPDEFRLVKDLFVIHGHPKMPTELSGADITVISAMGVAGNMAVSGEDETVSWSTGIDMKDMNPRSGLAHMMVSAFMNKVQTAAFRKIDPLIDTRINKANGEPWDDDDERWVVVAHLVNKVYVKSGFLRDYHVQQGELALKILNSWLPKIGDSL
jgi:hypothetical protein